MTASSAPAVIDALVTLASATLTTTMGVQDGPQMINEAGDLLAICFSGPLDPNNPYESTFIDTALQARQEAAEILSQQRIEALAIQCVMFGTGRDTHKAVRDFLYGRLTALDNAIRADVVLHTAGHLGAVCLTASISGDHRIMHMDTSSGWAAALVFAINARASL